MDSIPKASVKEDQNSVNELFTRALQDASVYGALVPWMLSREATPLARWAQERPALSFSSAEYGELIPCQLRAAFAEFVGQQCEGALSGSSPQPTGGHAACSRCAARTVLTKGPPASPSRAARPSHLASGPRCGAVTRAVEGGAACRRPGQARPTPQTEGNSLSPAASRMAKLHGHMLAHGFLVPTLEQAGGLLAMLLAGPVPASEALAAAPARSGSSHAGGTNAGAGDSKCYGDGGGASGGGGRRPAPRPADTNDAASDSDAASSPLLCCAGAAAQYAAKVLCCAGRLLQGLGPQLMSQLATTPQLQVTVGDAAYGGVACQAFHLSGLGSMHFSSALLAACNPSVCFVHGKRALQPGMQVVQRRSARMQVVQRRAACMQVLLAPLVAFCRCNTLSQRLPIPPLPGVRASFGTCSSGRVPTAVWGASSSLSGRRSRQRPSQLRGAADAALHTQDCGCKPAARGSRPAQARGHRCARACLRAHAG